MATFHILDLIPTSLILLLLLVRAFFLLVETQDRNDLEIQCRGSTTLGHTNPLLRCERIEVMHPLARRRKRIHSLLHL
jgi:hypothetical protein